MTFKIHTHLSSIVIFQFVYICWCLWYLKICLWCKSFLNISKCGLFYLPRRLISSCIYKFGHGIWNRSKALKIITFIFWKVLPWINEYLYLLMSVCKQWKQTFHKRPYWKYPFKWLEKNRKIRRRDVAAVLKQETEEYLGFSRFLSWPKWNVTINI